MLELGDDRVFVRPLTQGECLVVMADVNELDSVRTHLGAALGASVFLLALSKVLMAVAVVGLLAALARNRRHRAARRRELADGRVLEICSPRRRLRVLADSGRLLDPNELPREGEAR